MKITSRELILIFVLISATMVYVLYTFLFNPLLANVSVARDELSSAQAQVAQIEYNKNNLPEVKKQQKIISLEAEEKVAAYLPDLSENLITTFFAGTVNNGGTAITRIAFEPLEVINLGSLVPIPREELAYTYGDLVTITEEGQATPLISTNESGEMDNAKNILVQRANVQFETATYEQVLEQLRQVENLNRTIQISTFTFGKTEEGFGGNIVYNFYGLDKPTDSDPGLNLTPLTDPVGKANPFN